MSAKKKVALIGGGYSEEASISMQSCAYLMRILEDDEMDFTLVRIVDKNEWIAIKDELSYPIDKGDFSYINGGKKTFDLAFIYIHGSPGEDGKLQNYFDLIGQKYVGCSGLVSALTFNKHFTKRIAEGLGVCTAESFLVRPKYYRASDPLPALPFPLIVKPNEGGSSIGIRIVHKEKELGESIRESLATGEDLLAERLIVGREFSVGMYRNEEGKIDVLPATEIVSQNEFFDFSAKYENQSEEITPADIDDDCRSRIEKDCALLYQGLQCEGAVRADFIWQEESRKLYFLEVNTIPGLTQTSILPQQFRERGIDLKKFYLDLLKNALAR